EFVREHFLLTRQLRDYLTMLLSLDRQASNNCSPPPIRSVVLSLRRSHDGHFPGAGRRDMPWPRERLEDVARNRLGGAKLVVVANREPYLHSFDGEGIRCTTPASGLTTP